jgi:glutathione S-transferase
MRYWNKFIDEHVMNQVSMHGWHRLVGVIARNIESGEFEQLVERIPLPDQRKKWKTARSGFSEADLDNATRKIVYALQSTRSRTSSARPNGWRARPTRWPTSISIRTAG